MKFVQILFACAAFFLSGCELVLVHISTNIPFFYGYSAEVINSSDYELEVAVSGRPMSWECEDGVKRDRLAPGETGTIRLRNYGGYSSYAQANISVKAWDTRASASRPESRPSEQFAGANYRSVWVSGYYTQADTWVVRNEDFRR